MIFILTKYPVASEYGKYRVDIEESYSILSYYSVVLFQEKKLNKNKIRFEKVRVDTYDLKDWDFDFVSIAKDIVKKYEEISELTRQFNNKINDAGKSFALWNGIINE
ncbi:hypothetical protein [Paenibacillus sp. FSL E2-0178]|uniref:hypothetical protein n=1 Tax=Paenibacillus sp. FSL E2-0178 TaxID=2921361 RepID=UPI003158EA58